MTSQIPREAFQHGSDCSVTFVRRADGNRSYVDVWKITVHNRPFYFQMMKMRKSGGPWVFGSFSDAATGQQLWKFRDDPRAKAGFKGASFTFVHDDVSYVLFENHHGVQHVLLFVDFLLNPKTVAEVTGELRQAILQSYATDRLSTPAVAAIDPRKIAALRAAKQREREEQAEQAQQQTAAASVTIASKATPQQGISDASAQAFRDFLQELHARAGSADAEHAWFFQNVLAYMCTPQPN